MIFRRSVLFIFLLTVFNARADDDVSHKHGDECGALYGRVIDADTQAPVAGTQIYIMELNRSGVSHDDGWFFLPGLPFGTYTLQTFRIGYQSVFQKFRIAVCDTNRIVVKTTNSPLQMQSLVVIDESADSKAGSKPLHMEGKKLRQELGRTIAETIADEPGLDQRTMGPAPARPVIRGMGGDRLLVLEDGERTGDLSATSADHAVVVEPMTADRIEVIRGPGALVYGSNTLGGVINVARGYVPTTFLDHVHGTFTYQGETVNKGHSGGFRLSGPLGPFSLRIDGSKRQSNDINTPVGRLTNTALATMNGSAGISLVNRWGYLGVAGSYYKSDYGIPGGFVGAHPNGVDIGLERKHLEIKSSLNLDHPVFRRIDAHLTYSRYFHQEFESNGALGIEFGLISYHASLSAKIRNMGVLQNGRIGLWSEYRNHAAGGYSFTPPTEEETIAGYYYQEAILGNLDMKGSVRFDVRRVRPEHEKESYRIGLVRKRTFNGLSAAVSAHYHLMTQFYMGISLMRSFRAPGIEELFSEGPHLAAYSFETGNPDLGKETGTGVEYYLNVQWQNGGLQLALFRNDIADYIFPQNTGQLNYRTLLPTYQFMGLNAIMTGLELGLEQRVFHHFAVFTGLNYVRGTLTGSDVPLPWMPPLNGKLDMKYNREKYSIGVRFRASSDQKRVGEFEAPTDGYFVSDLFAQYIFSVGPFLSTIDLNIINVADTGYRRHLSRVKSIMPEPGRNFKVLYRIYF